MQASPLERAELHVTTAQAIQTLFCLYLRLHGTSPEDHPIAKEDVSTRAKSVYLLKSTADLSCTVAPFQDRISRFKRKVSKVNSENLLKNSKRATEVNIQAANRFITAAIPELSIQQKQALRQVVSLFSSDFNFAHAVSHMQTVSCSIVLVTYVARPLPFRQEPSARLSPP